MGTLFEVSGSTGAVNFKEKGTSNLVLEQGTSVPGSGVEGHIFWRSDVDTLFVHNGTSYQGIGAGYNRVYNEVPSGLVNGSNTLFTLANAYVNGTTSVYRDGLLMKAGGVDYTETSPSAATITFTTAPSSGSIILVSYSRIEAAMLPSMTKFNCVVGTPSSTYTGSTTVFDLPFAYTVGNNALLVYASGILMLVGASADYQESTTSRITFNSARTAGEVIQFVKLGYNDATGEVNTAANVGSGTGLIFRDKIGTVVNLKSLIAGTGITINNNTNDITINASVAAAGGWQDNTPHVDLVTSTNQVRFGNGSAATPAISFLADTTTGIFRSGSSSIGLTLGGTQIIEFDSGVITPGSDNTVALGSTALGWTRLFMKGGTSSSPAYTWRDEPTSGFYRSATAQVALSLLTNVIGTFSSTGITSNKQGTTYLVDSLEDGTALAIGHSNLLLSYNPGSSEQGWIIPSRGDSGGTVYGSSVSHNFFEGTSTQASQAYSSKDNTNRYFVLSSDPFSTTKYPIPGSSFTIGGNTYTVRAYRFANSRLFVYEDISGEAASGTLTNVKYGILALQINSNNQVLTTDGGAGSPSHSFLNSTGMGFFRAGTDILAATTASTERMRIDASGKVGINTTNTSANYQVRINSTNTLGLSVYSTAGSSAAYMNLENDSANIWQFASMGSGTASPNNLQINYNGTNLLNWTQNSNIIFNHTANTNGQSQFEFVNAGTGYGSFTAVNTAASQSLQMGTAGTGAGGNWNASFPIASSCYIQANTTNGLAIQTAGAGSAIVFLTNSTTALSLTSSQRVLLGSDGTAASPAFAFGNESSTGMYRVGSGHMALTLSGTNRLDLNGTALTWNNNGSHVYFYLDRANTSSEGLVVYSTNGTTKAAVGLDNDSTDDLCFFANGNLGTPVMRIVAAGTAFIPTTDNATDNGNSSHRWANLWATTVHSGDVQMENDWRITEGFKVGHPEEGIMFLSPEGKKFKIAMTEVE